MTEKAYLNVHFLYKPHHSLFALRTVENTSTLEFRGGEGNGTHSSTFAWKVAWTEEPGRLQSMGSLELDTTERLHFQFSLSCIGEGNGTPLQYFCLENPRDGEAWWAAIYGVAQSRTRLKRVSSSSRRVLGYFKQQNH